MANFITTYKDDGDSALPSPIIWGDCPVLEMVADARGFHYFEDFRHFLGDAGAAATAPDPYKGHGTTGVTIKQLVGQRSGVLQVAGNDADNDEGSISFGETVSSPFVISDSYGVAKKLWFECRIKKESIAANSSALFIGLAEEGLAATGTLAANTGALADKDMIGFSVLQDSGAEVDFTYNKDGAGGVNLHQAAINTMTADTYVKLGFVYDPDAPEADRIRVYVNGVETSTPVAASDISASDFPDGEELTFLFATKVGTAAESTVEIDWWRCAQMS